MGKTHLAVAVLKQVIVTFGARGLFYDTRDLLRVIRSTYDPSIRTTELQVLQPVMTRRTVSDMERFSLAVGWAIMSRKAA